uniref:B30.2/SPRY domain-containing protein n=1 Tax=Astyanax mexicanus TaxID=7994 RepID=A0A3B1IM12_ASTMX
MKSRAMDSVDWKNVSQTTSLTLPVENVATQWATHSVPWNKPTLSNKKPVLKPMQPLDECVQLLKDMAKELEDLGESMQGCQKYIPRSADVYLDPSSCHPWLCVSEDRREVRERSRPEDQQHIYEHGPLQRSCVLGLNSFSTGRHYWEVLVPRHGSWKLGVVSASAPRTGIFPINPETGYWCIWKGPKNLWACTDPHTRLQQCLQSQVVGVFLDYEEGQVSFYDVSRSFHIYTFTQIFKEALFPVFVCLDGTVLKVQTVQAF